MPKVKRNQDPCDSDNSQEGAQLVIAENFQPAFPGKGLPNEEKVAARYDHRKDGRQLEENVAVAYDIEGHEGTTR